MGILNVTPDSFSGDGLGGDTAASVARASAFAAQGADLLDIGGESTRPGHQPVDAEEELRRVLPHLRRVRAEVGLPVSVDTSKAAVAWRALEHGAALVNDVWGLQRDPAMARVIAEHGVPVVLMHNQTHTEYREVVSDVVDWLSRSIDLALGAGIAWENLIVDPGIGFGKTLEHNLEILDRLGEIRRLGRPILVGTSRKSMIGRVLGLPPDQRVEGTAATVAIAIARGADVVRVHDVQEMVRVCRMADAVVRRGRTGR
ncbi:MAG: dihydropteroate synthase [Chloroflexi bacterium]|nr:dihydropteroate synthase [Chloroflexota bacterium]